MVQAQLSQQCRYIAVQFEKDEERMLKTIQQLVCHKQKDELLQIDLVNETYNKREQLNIL